MTSFSECDAAEKCGDRMNISSRYLRSNSLRLMPPVAETGIQSGKNQNAADCIRRCPVPLAVTEPFTGFTPSGYPECKRCFTFPGRGFPVIKNRVRELRQQKNVTQIQMARDLQITRQTLIAIERHKYHPSLELAFRIARYFGKRVDEVFLWEEDGD
jgi:putative transcriptional regulator